MIEKEAYECPYCGKKKAKLEYIAVIGAGTEREWKYAAVKCKFCGKWHYRLL